MTLLTSILLRYSRHRLNALKPYIILQPYDIIKMSYSDVVIGDVTIPIVPPKRKDLVPKGFLALFGDLSSPNNAEIVAHMHWIAQKNAIGQDIFLLSHPGNLTRHIVLALAELCDWEVEHLIISKDTSESDLKQRREIVDGGVIFIDQPAVRAAMHGRLLILDGIENAERNVLPTLNNLLENREMALEDGRFLTREEVVAATQTKKHNLVPVHSSFRVVALGCPVPPYQGRSLDPPLRSRFQGRFVDELSVETMLSCLNTAEVSRENLQTLVNFYESLRSLRADVVTGNTSLENLLSIPTFSFQRLSHTMNLLRSSVGVGEALARSFPLGCYLSDDGRDDELGKKLFPSVCASVARLGLVNVRRDRSEGEVKDGMPAHAHAHAHIRELTSPQSTIALRLLDDLARGSSVCLLGPKGSGKSHIVSCALASSSRTNVQLFPLYQEMGARDLLQRRSTSTDESGLRTDWRDSPLVSAARAGTTCVLDGIDRLDPHCLLAVSRLLCDAHIDLPSGERLQAHTGFRVVALGSPPVSADDARRRYLSSGMAFSYHALQPMSPSQIDEIAFLETGLGPLGIQLSNTFLSSALSKLHELNVSELRPSLRTSLRAYKILRGKQLSEKTITNADVIHILENIFMVRFLSPQSIAQFQSVMASLELVPSKANGSAISSAISISVSADADTLSIGGLTVRRRSPTEVALVPMPLFYENPAQNVALRDILAAYSMSDDPVLLIGNQGVGKNKLVDYLLHLLRAEREYVQLHRDTTIQSLTVQPRIDLGMITYEDTPLVRAARLGRVLVLDEADKAPLEVVCMLKSLVGDGELLLADGRRLLSRGRMQRERSLSSSSLSEEAYCETNNVLLIHEAFRLFVLANRPGMPFLGNNFFRELGDLFSTFVIENPDVESEHRLLVASAPQCDSDEMRRLAMAFASLRKHHEDGQLGYPFSAREAVAVAKHLQAYPRNGLFEALENVLAFDELNATNREYVAGVFKRHGFDVRHTSSARKDLFGSDGKPLRITGGTAELGREAGESVPRTGLSFPKHGKEDDKPHVGGNTWAGGTGGSDTAGLGGRGGPYRLDKGHAIHQVSDEEKAKVSDEARRAAAAMASEAFEQRLKEIDMGRADYATFKKYSENVELQVNQIREILQEVLRRRKERMWLRNQNYGELDDCKLVDGLVGDKLIFKRRGLEGSRSNDPLEGESEENRKRRIQFVVDVSGSMMRFNGLDRRLERMLEASLMIMEALPRKKTNSLGSSSSDIASLIDYSLAGHSGDTENVVFVDFSDHVAAVAPEEENGNVDRYFSSKSKRRKIRRMGPLSEKDKMAILETMIAHSQFCVSGDNTLGAIEAAVTRVSKRIALKDDTEEKLVIVVSDANFRRYGIQAEDLAEAMQKDPTVHVHLILIASLKDEAKEMTSKLPQGSCHICFDSATLPTIIRKILTANIDDQESS